MSETPEASLPAEIDQLRRAFEDSRAVQERARRIRQCQSSEQIIREFSEAARAILGSAATQFYVREPQGGKMLLHNRTGDTAIRRLGFEPWRPQQELLDWVTREARTTTVPGKSEKEWHTLVPLVVAGQVSGILVLDVPEAADDVVQQTVQNLTFLAEEAAASLLAAEDQARVRDDLSRMEREHAFLTNILDSITNGLLVLDLDGRILQINRNAAAMLDIPSLDVIGQPWDPLVGGEVGVELRAIIDETIQVGFAMERLVTTRLGGTELPLAVGSSLLRDTQLQVFGVILVFRDMTASREMDRLRKLDQMKSDFVANVSHELRTPLTSIKAYCEALTGMAATEQEQEFLKVIEEEGDRLLELIEDLLNVSRIASGNLKLNLEKVEPGTLVPEVLGVAKVQTKKHKIVTNVPKDLPPMVLDRNRVKEILINLVSNAIKYSPEGGTVTLTMKVEEGNLRIDVEDQGIGISEADQTSLFQQFFRADSSMTAQVGGTGLGLAIVKGIAEAHGGTISLKSTLGKGSTFTVILPVRKEAPRGTAEPSPF